MATDEIYAKLHEIFADIFLRDDIELTATTTAADVEGWDSFRMIEIVLAVQEQFGIKLHTKELDNLKNVGDLVTIIVNKAK
jgi:acyl carrier protein